MPKSLGCMTGALGMGYEWLHLFWRCRAGYDQGDSNFLEVRGRVINIVLFCIAEESRDIGGGFVYGHMVKRREPRQLGEQSECDSHHEVL
jgi:hypothetical protein